MSDKSLHWRNRFEQAFDDRDGFARIQVRIRYDVQIALNRAQIIVIRELNPAREFDVIQRSGELAIPQWHKRLEVDRGAFHAHGGSGHASIRERASQRVCESGLKLRCRREWEQQGEICARIERENQLSALLSEKLRRPRSERHS